MKESPKRTAAQAAALSGQRGRRKSSTPARSSSGECLEAEYDACHAKVTPIHYTLDRLFFNCSIAESCHNVECEPGKSCVVRRGTPKCVCSSCKEGKKKPKGPVCGTDGRTYRNWCRMKKKACKQRLRNLSVAYYGVCQSECPHFHQNLLIELAFFKVLVIKSAAQTAKRAC